MKKQPTRNPIKKIKQLFTGKILKEKKNVAVINLHGVIGSAGRFSSGISIHSLNHKIEKAFKIKNLTAIILSVNSPGGSPVQSELIYKRIRQLAEEKNIKVISIAEDVAASGGYWLLCAGDEIYSSKNSIIGSIGVIAAGFGFDKALKKLDIDRRVYTQGENKSILDPFLPEKKSEVKILTDAQKDVHENFIQLVKTRRKKKLMADDTKLFNGEFWSGLRAKDLGLVDGFGDVHSVVYEKYGKETKIITIETEKTWLKKKLGLEGPKQNVLKEIMNLVDCNVFWQRFGL